MNMDPLILPQHYYNQCKRKRVNILDSYFIQLFQHNKMIINEQTLKERSQLYDFMTCNYVKHVLKSPHTLHSLPSTSAIHESQMCPCDTYLCREYIYNYGDNRFAFPLKLQMFKFDNDRFIFTAVLFSFSLKGVH